MEPSFSGVCYLLSETRVSQIKIKVSTFFSIFGDLPFWRRFAFNIFKKWNCPPFFVLIGSLADITKQTLMFVFGFVIWFTASGQLRSNIICKNTITLSISDLSMSILLKTRIKQHKFLEKLSMKRGNFQDEFRRQIKIEPGYLSGGLNAQSDLASCEDNTVFMDN